MVTIRANKEFMDEFLLSDWVKTTYYKYVSSLVPRALMVATTHRIQSAAEAMTWDIKLALHIFVLVA